MSHLPNQPSVTLRQVAGRLTSQSSLDSSGPSSPHCSGRASRDGAEMTLRDNIEQISKDSTVIRCSIGPPSRDSTVHASKESVGCVSTDNVWQASSVVTGQVSRNGDEQSSDNTELTHKSSSDHTCSSYNELVTSDFVTQPSMLNTVRADCDIASRASKDSAGQASYNFIQSTRDNTDIASRENSANSISILAGLEELLENSLAVIPSESFVFIYRGSSEVDRHYTKAMLPWIIAEIKNQKKYDKVKVEICNGMVHVRSFVDDALLISHSVKQIHKCVMEQADHSHFLYTLKPSQERDSNGSKQGRLHSMQQQLDLFPAPPVPANSSADTDHHCHLFKAETEQDVRNFFKCLREQPREPQQFRTNSQKSVHSLPDLLLHNDSQFYEVLFVGRVKVSHARLPESFIDEACEAFKNKKPRVKPRHSSSTETETLVSEYQKEGSGSSAPNITFSEGIMKSGSRRNSQGTDGGESSRGSPGVAGHHQFRVRFTLDTDIDQQLYTCGVHQDTNKSYVACNKKNTFAIKQDSIGIDSKAFQSDGRLDPSVDNNSVFSDSLGQIDSPLCSAVSFSESSDVSVMESRCESSEEPPDEVDGSRSPVRTFSIRVPEKVNWFLSSETPSEKGKDVFAARETDANGVSGHKKDLTSNIVSDRKQSGNQLPKLVRQDEIYGEKAFRALLGLADNVRLRSDVDGLTKTLSAGVQQSASASVEPQSVKSCDAVNADLARTATSTPVFNGCKNVTPQSTMKDDYSSRLQQNLKRRCSDQHCSVEEREPFTDQVYHSLTRDSLKSDDPSWSLLGSAEPGQKQHPSLFTALRLSSMGDSSSSLVSESGFPGSPLCTEDSTVFTSDADDKSFTDSSKYEPRMRTISGSAAALKLRRGQLSAAEHPMRARAGSIGSAMTRPRLARPVCETEHKGMSGEFNRTMLFHIGREELQLINPELKHVQLHKNFNDITQRCQGVCNKDHLGFICREVSGELPVYVGYVFRSESPDLTTEILQSLNKAFEAVQKEKQESSMCSACPMRWFSSLCSELEGLSASRSHGVILRRIQELPENDRDLLLAKYEGADAPELHRKNQVLMMLLRAHMESRQQSHMHIVPQQQHQKGAESSLFRVKKSLATSFQQFLKRESVVSESLERGEGTAPDNTKSEVKTRAASPVAYKGRVENVSESPLAKHLGHRPRSSTLSAAGGDSMRREFKASLQKSALKLEVKPPLSAKEGAVPSIKSDTSSATAEHQNQASSHPKVAASHITNSSDYVEVPSPGCQAVQHCESKALEGTLAPQKLLHRSLGVRRTLYENWDKSEQPSISPSIENDTAVVCEKIDSSSPAAGDIISLNSTIKVVPKQEISSHTSQLNNSRRDDVSSNLVMSKEVAAELFSSGLPSPAISSDTAEDKKNIPSNQSSHHKVDIFLKVGSPPPSSAVEEEDPALLTSPSPSFRHAILQRVITPVKPGQSLDEKAATSSPLTKSMSQPTVSPAAAQAVPFMPGRIRRSWPHLRMLWKKVVFKQILLSRIERAAQVTRAIEEERELQRVCLNYDEEPVDEEVLDTWQLVLSRPYSRLDQSILLAGVRQGVPKALRGEIWMLLVNQQQLLLRSVSQQGLGFGLPYQFCVNHQPSYPSNYDQPYQEMIKGLTSQQHAILIDLGRTFPQHPYFTRTLGPGQLGLFNLLKGYSLLDKDVGYCQGLSFVAGILLLHVNEESAYTLLKHLMYVSGVRRQFRKDLDGLQVQMYQLSRLLHDRLYKVYNHFETNDISPQLYAAPWFLTLFASTFPLHFVVRLYDMLFMLGLEAVFRVSLLLLQEHEIGILACDGFEETMTYLKARLPAISVDKVGKIFETAFELRLGEQLMAYELEYQVLREELCVTPPQHQATVDRLAEERRNLKRQNLDLVEQLQIAQSQKRALESSNQMLQQSQHHLEVRVRFLEVERNNLKQIIELLCKVCEENHVDSSSSLPPGLLRYLPSHSSAPRLLDRSNVDKMLNERSPMDYGADARATSQGTEASDDEDLLNSHSDAVRALGRDISVLTSPIVQAAKNASDVKPVPVTASAATYGRTSTASKSPPALAKARLMQLEGRLPLVSRIPATNQKADGACSQSSLFPPFNLPSLNFPWESSGTPDKPYRQRSSTMDHGSMQRFMRGLTKNN